VNMRGIRQQPQAQRNRQQPRIAPLLSERSLED
jgi:hypothetical protein